KTKSEVFKFFKEFQSLVEKQTDRKIKILRTDNGGEYCSQDFERYLKQHGIIHQKSNAYTPQQNGVCERMNRSLVEKARCLIFDAGLHKKFWAEAINTSVYLRNRTVVTGLNNMTPYEAWTKKKPDLSHVRIFGSKVMMHIPKEKRLKWDMKAK
ncbi:transposase family protein, partial [Pseudomonas aeruginosa]